MSFESYVGRMRVRRRRLTAELREMNDAITRMERGEPEPVRSLDEQVRAAEERAGAILAEFAAAMEERDRLRAQRDAEQLTPAQRRRELRVVTS